MLKCLWQNEWLDMVQKTNKGKALCNIKNKIEYWPWTSHKNRLVESALARLRIGHVGLNKHLFRFNLSSTDQCLCGNTETIEHFLLICPIQNQNRIKLKKSLDTLGVPLTVGNVLGGGDFPRNIQFDILNEVSRFLLESGKLGTL